MKKQPKLPNSKEAVEARLLELAREMRDTVRAYSPDSEYFNLCIMGLNWVSIGNNYWENEKPIKVEGFYLDGRQEDD